MNKNVIKSVTLISVIFCLLWLVGLGWAVTEYYAGKPDKIQEKTNVERKTEKKDGLHIVAIGDSLTRGTGDETGKGYVGYLLDEIKEKSKQDVRLTNLGISGQESGQLKEQIQQTEVKRQLQSADMILVTMGGNDLFRGGQGLLEFENADIEDIEKKFLKNMNFIFQQIRASNSEANVFFIGLYNPFSELEQGKEMSAVVRHWNYQSAELSAAFPKIVFVPTFDLFELRVNDYLYTDKFHPNTKGYRLIAERVASLLTW
ncbi:lysophospholipase L1-like esterase [Neobacillus niacini]|jgi:lysophospholipase L1-like esterase|uniref:SGNH/GDSL hydrolase family protein n=1 Tax=Neobacillus driksii TaxID=3035913 RepID=UPI00277F8745|nr:SGNH/GDSL hydrolase family protein [Neobacillus niacini]MDQ0971966.1 lysophospholipase L1-like esterase [Neobacillus niacini]